MTTLTTTAETERSVSVAAICSVLDDEFTREVLEAVAAEEKTVRELTADCDASRTTIYRRLDRLEDAGLVDVEMTYDSDGHHRRRYRARRSTLTLALDGDGLSVRIATETRSTAPCASRLRE